MSSQIEDSKSYLKTIMIISTFGGLLFGYDTGVVNGALPYMAQPDQLNLTPLHEGMVASSLLLGATFGSVIGGKISDMQGRRKNIFMLSVLFFIATLGCSLAPSFEVMLISRFALGLAVGGASVTVPAYLAEVSPSEKRGRMVTQNELMIVTGQFLAFVFNALIAVALAGDPHVWRYMLAVAALPAVVLFFGMMRLPESPRWLVSKGKVSEALGVLKKIRETDKHAISELNDIQDTITAEKNIKQVSFKDLNTPWIRRIILIGMGIATFTQLTGVNSIMYYGTQILNQSGFSMQAALIANTLNGLTSVIAVCVGISLMTKIRRRTMLLTGLSGTTTALFLITVSSTLLENSPYLPFIILSLTVMFLAFMQSCIGPILWLLLSEIIPLRVRGLGMGICVLFHWITNFVVGLTFPVLLSALGLQSTFLIFVIIGFVSLTFVKLFVPETKGKTLEQIEHGFRHYNRKEMQSVGSPKNA
ncbi:MAG TPA: sugar porter family MFS transporter [Candidatus Megamonas gallistercoris]|nr:sugar porter family MFS transporter [Candidatus Megamonas gallistercoris]